MNSAAWEGPQEIATEDERTLYLYYRDDGPNGHTIELSSTDCHEGNSGDLGLSLLRHRVAHMMWLTDVVSYIGVEPGWERQGLGRQMWSFARERSPNVKHDFERMTYSGWRLASAIDPDGVVDWTWNDAINMAVPRDSPFVPPVEPEAAETWTRPSWLRRLTGRSGQPDQ